MSFHIIRNDITRVHADAIVNTANPEPVCAGGTDFAIYEAAGMEQLLEERRKIGRIARGSAVETPAFRLHAKYIIHTVGPVWQGGTQGEFDILKSCYKNSLQLALKLKCRSIAFPLIATGVYGFPKDQALQIAMSVIQPFVMEHAVKVILVVFDKRAFELSGTVVENIREYVDANYVDEARRKEYAIDSVRGRQRRNRPLYESRQDLSDFSLAPQRDITRRRNREKYPDDSFEMDNLRFACEAIDREESVDLRDLEASFSDEPVCTDTDTYADTEFSSLSYTQGSQETESNKSGPARNTADLCPAEAASVPVPAPSTAIPAHKNASIRRQKVDIGALLAATQKTFQEKLFEIIDSRGLTGPQVYKNYISKQVFSKIQSDKNYHPNKFTAIALCLSLHLNIEETQDLIGRAGWALSPSNKADVVVTGCILNGEYNLVKINIILFDFDLPELEKIK